MRRFLLILLGLGLVFLALVRFPESLSGPIRSAVRESFAPILSIPLWVAGHNPFSAGWRERADEIVRLEVESERLRAEISRLTALERENAVLRGMVGLAERASYRLLAAQVISRDVSGWWQSARLNRGRLDGVEKDWPVITPEGLVGRTTDLTEHTCDVLFLIDPTCKISARLSRLDAFGIVRGEGVSLRGDASCRMDFVLKDAEVMRGDEVVTSGLGGVYPPGLVIGYVGKVFLDKSGLYQYAEIVPAADLRALDLVFVAARERARRAGVTNQESEFRSQ